MQQNTAAAAQPQDQKKLRDTINLVDALAQEGFSQIRAIASVALRSLETPNSYQFTQDISDVLIAIKKIASDAEDCINQTAEEVGCDYVDAHRQRRIDAEMNNFRQRVA